MSATGPEAHPPGSGGDRPPPDAVAALDLGSNSFHMIVAGLRGGEPVVIDRIREQVQLAAGLDEKGRLADDAKQRALECLRRFGQRLADLHASHVRAVGTNTLRAARDRAFVEQAREALGHPIEIISGREEARLVYLGVAHTLADDRGSRLVVDIGGGSTECILGERFEALETHSLSMGCVRYSQRYFPEGVIDKESFRKAVLGARLELRTVERRFRDIGWTSAVGSSGTIRAVASVLRESGWARERITADGLRALRKALIGAGRVDALELPGLKPERAAVFPGGVAVLVAVFEAFELEEMSWSPGALREGVLYDLLGRIRHEDVRERTLRALQERYHVDRAQAARVERTALRLLSMVAEAWDLTSERARLFLGWAAQLHEVGLAVSYTHHHRHGAYLLEHSDMPGFSNDDSKLLATLVGGHRRKFVPETLAEFDDDRRLAMLRLTVLLRLAALLNRGRSPRPRPRLDLVAKKKALELRFPTGWLEAHPLTRVDLDEEARWLAAADFGFEVHEASPAS
ncbi:MAG: exopolyphosphatase [Planctomycetes bacterium]|nr:exopolyphosphatase [Planctomycetota bacterium]